MLLLLTAAQNIVRNGIFYRAICL